MLTTLRERFWVLRGRETEKKIIRHCVICCRYEATPCKPSQFADLPENRVPDDPPFTHIGLDFTGTLYVKEPRTSSKKRSLCIQQQSVCVFISMHVDSGRSFGTDSRTECARLLISLPQIRQQTRTTGYGTIGQRENLPIFQQGNPKHRPITGGLEISHQQSN